MIALPPYLLPLVSNSVYWVSRQLQAITTMKLLLAITSGLNKLAPSSARPFVYMPGVVAAIYGSASMAKLLANTPNSGSDLITDPHGAAIKVTVILTIAAFAVFGLLTWREHKSPGFLGERERNPVSSGVLL